MSDSGFASTTDKTVATEVITRGAHRSPQRDTESLGSSRYTDRSPLLMQLDAEPIVDAVAHRAACLVLEHMRRVEIEHWIGVDEAAAHLACPKSRIYRLVSQRTIPFEKDGARLLFKRSMLDDWVAQGGADR